MIRRLKTLLAAAALFGTGILAAQPATSPPMPPLPAASAPAATACLENAAPAASGASAPAALPRLASLSYRCLALRGGQPVLVGEAGSPHAPPVLLVHGLGHNAHRDWAPVIAPLARQFHVIVVDLPGFGASPGGWEAYSFKALADVLLQVLDLRAPGRRAHVVGHSLGGAVSLYFAHAHASRVDRLVLVDAAGILLKTVFVQHIASMRTPQTGVAPVDRFLKGLGERLGGLRRGVFHDLDDRFDFSRWLAQNPNVRYLLLGRHTQIEAGLGLVEHDFTAAMRETRAPTTVIWGSEDPIAPPRTGRVLAAHMPDARLQVMEGVGHTPMLESPDAFRGFLLDALAAPFPPRPVPKAPGPSNGDLVCRNLPDQRYSGRYDSLTLDNCPGARISGALLRKLVLVKSSGVVIDDTVIEADDVAIEAQGSEVTATNLTLSGRVGIRSDASRFDLAGASLRTREQGVEMTSYSRFFFSVSEWHGSDHAGDAHFLWPQAATAR